jgi:hypothetical protein
MAILHVVAAAVLGDRFGRAEPAARNQALAARLTVRRG